MSSAAVMIGALSLSAYTGDNPLAKARGLSPRTSGQTVV